MVAPLRKVVASSPGLNMRNRPCFRLALECSHSVTRSKDVREVRCAECPKEEE